MSEPTTVLVDGAACDSISVHALEERHWPVGPVARHVQALIARDDARA